MLSGKVNSLGRSSWCLTFLPPKNTCLWSGASSVFGTPRPVKFGLQVPSLNACSAKGPPSLRKASSMNLFLLETSTNCFIQMPKLPYGGLARLTLLSVRSFSRPKRLPSWGPPLLPPGPQLPCKLLGLLPKPGQRCLEPKAEKSL